jgi:uncharacterized protein (DUF1684 family)
MATETPEEYRERLERDRERKVEFLAEHPRSPVPQDARESFEQPFFPPDPELRFEVPLDEHDATETLTIATTTDGEREYLRWGEFAVEVDGEPVTLQAYKAEPDDGRLWVPFRDETNGEETYGGGRYLDLEEDEHHVDGRWVLDLNEAYNPYCAYNDAYECPMVPMENWLDVRVEAGEKQPDLPSDRAHAPDHEH